MKDLLRQLPTYLFIALLGMVAALVLRLALHGGSSPATQPATQPTTQQTTQPATQPTAEPPPVEEQVDYQVNNAICVGMGKKTRPTSRMVLEGLEILMCCDMCADDIREDPAAAISKLLDDERGGPGLAAYLKEHPELARKLGVAPEGPAYKVNNAKCAVMGGETDPEATMMLEGMEILLCCPPCEDDIRDDPATAIKTLLADERAGKGLAAYLATNPELSAKLGVAPPDAGAKEHSRTSGGRQLTTPLANHLCPLDDKPTSVRITAQHDGLQVRLCSEECREAFPERAEAAVSALERSDPDVARRIEAHLDLSARDGEGPRYECASCELSSAASGHCPECGKGLRSAELAEPFALGNKTCPVMGEPIEKDHQLVHEGIAVNICCPECQQTFRQYPPYYLGKLERQEGIRIPRTVGR